jgi:hypothetical protein
MPPVEKYRCPCCGCPTLDEPPPGTFAICRECGWEDDPVQAADPDAGGGANLHSLREARHDYQSRHAAACFPNLAHLMNAYFHQDWDLDAEGEAGTVRLFLSMEPEAAGQGLREELRVLAEDAWAEDELVGLFRNLGGYLIPTTDWRGWVSLVCSVADDRLTH